MLVVQLERRTAFESIAAIDRAILGLRADYRRLERKRILGRTTALREIEQSISALTALTRTIESEIRVTQESVLI